MSPEPVRFDLVDDPSPASTSEGDEPTDPRPDRGRVEEAGEDPYPLAGPILETARARQLRGRCSSCDSRLRLEVPADARSPVQVRCSVCGHVGRVEP